MPKWTKEQEAAIDTSGCNLLVSAAAGSGKTAVLSERVIQKLLNKENPVNIDEFLILTFTDAAAAEMKERISKKLAEALESQPDNRHLARQIVLIGRASITTIHSFCLSVIKNYFHLLDLDPEVRPGDDTEMKLLQQEVMQQCMEEAYSGPEGAAVSDLCERLGNGREELFSQRLLDVYQSIQSFPNPLQWLRQSVERYREPDGASLWAGMLKNSYAQQLEGLEGKCREVLEFISENGLECYRAALENDLESIIKLKEAANVSWETLRSAAEGFSMGAIGRKSADISQNTADRCKKLREEMKKSLEQLVGNVQTLDLKQAQEALEDTYAAMELLYRLIEAFHTAYRQAKKEKNRIDFNDFEHYALELLQAPDLDVAQQMREKYTEIFVDEYQDCNQVQEAIFQCIARKKEGKSCNVFMVGDVKQSIYRFRKAEPSMFLEKSRTYTIGAGLQRKIVLNRNFRSRKEILSCVNHIFHRIMSETVGEMEYTQDEELIYAFPYPDDMHSLAEVPQLMLGVKGPSESEEESDGEPAGTLELEAKLICNEIERLMSSGYRVFDKDREAYRPLMYRDIVILRRSVRENGRIFEEECKSRGIPIFVDTGTGYFKSLEVRLLMSLLRIIDNPIQDIPLIGVMRSALFDFSEGELMEIRALHEGQFYFALKKCAGERTDVGQKCAEFLNQLNLWREKAIAVPTDRFLHELLEELDFYSYVQSLPGGEEKSANIKLIFDLAKTFESSNYKGLYNFITYLDRLEKNADQGAAKILSENSNVVRLMTIHKSKGLEFPVVFLASVQARFSRKDTSGPLLLHPKYGIGADYFDSERRVKYPLLSKIAMEQKIWMDALSEEMRIFYVALTRARERLYLTGVIKNEDLREGWIAKSRRPLLPGDSAGALSFLDWAGACLGENLSLRMLSSAQICSAGEQKEQIQKIQRSKTSDKIYRYVSKRLEFQYPYRDMSVVPTKFSVTELKQRIDLLDDGLSVKLYQPALMQAPRFMEKEETVTAAQRGTATHLVLKKIDLHCRRIPEIKKEVESLVRQHFLTEAEGRSVSVQAIATLLDSSLGMRMRTAKRLYRELPFNMNFSVEELFQKPLATQEESVLVQGIIDALLVEEDGLVLVDYKTDRVGLSRGEILQKYKNQIFYYAQAAQRIFHLPVKERYIYLLENGHLFQV